MEESALRLAERARLTPAHRFARLGLASLTSLGLSARPQQEQEGFLQTLFSAVTLSADPDTAMVAYSRLADLWGDKKPQSVLPLPSSNTAFVSLIRVLGASRQMGMLMNSRADLIQAAMRRQCCSWNQEQRHDAMGAAMNAAVKAADTVSAVPSSSAATSQPEQLLAIKLSAMRREYYRQLASVMAWDLENDPLSIQPQVSAALSSLASAAIESAYELAISTTPQAEHVKFVVVAMGKLGAQELNYVSDCDLVFVCDPALDQAPTSATLSAEQVRAIGTTIAQKIQKFCSQTLPHVNEPALWDIDTALRPEGKDGPLVRTLEAFDTYYSKWAQNWEFQALLKARPIAGDDALAEQFTQMATRYVWSAAARPNFVYECRAMRERVESLIPLHLKDREIKLGKGGLRDVEFTVQMLQLVHGRSDESLRCTATLDALKALVAGGYVGKKPGAKLDECYRFERVLEHRQQMWELKRTHLFPDLGEQGNGGLDSARQISVAKMGANAELRRLARELSLLPDELVRRFDQTRRQVRRLHEEIYFRPLLPLLAEWSEDDLSLTTQAARQRYASIGFADPDVAMKRVARLTQGFSRAARINRIIFPSLLAHLGEGQDPDMGLLALERIEERFPEGSRYLGLLRDSSQAAQRLCWIVSNSRFLGDLLAKSVESVSWLALDADLQARTRESLDVQCLAQELRFGDDMPGFAQSLRALYRQEVERLALGWVVQVVSASQLRKGLTALLEAVIASAWRWTAKAHPAAGVSAILLGLGRFGGQETAFSSDADLMCVYEAQEGVDPELARSVTLARINDLIQIISTPMGSERGIDLDFDLRPEGKNGPLVRSFDSVATYYSQWAQTWEFQALLRARFVAGEPDLGTKIISTIINPVRYPQSGLTSSQVSEIQRMKARVEAERLPRAMSRQRALKLGWGGLSDVEWLIQTLQLQHAGEFENLHTTSTLDALDAAQADNLISAEDVQILRAAWSMVADARNAAYLWQGRAERADQLPDDEYSLGAMAACMGLGAHRGEWFENEILALMRRARHVFDSNFYSEQH